MQALPTHPRTCQRGGARAAPAPVLGDGLDRNRTSAALEQGTDVAEKLPNVNTESFSSQQPRGKGERSWKESKRAEKGLREAGPDWSSWILTGKGF